MEINLKEQIEYLLQWMQKNRAQNTGFGAPIIMLKSMLRGDDCREFGGVMEKTENSINSNNELPWRGISGYSDEI